MGIYTADGWIDYNKVDNYGTTFNALVGGRGIGKTYGALKHILFETPQKFMYLRRTTEELELCMTDEMNPFREINHDMGSVFHIKKEGKTYVVAGEDEKVVGSAISLSSVAKVKGMSAYDVEVIIFDEFIRDRNQRKTIKDEAHAFFNLYETVCRNRELLGKPPVKVYMLANATDSANPIFMALNLVMTAEKLKRQKHFPAVYKDVNRGLLLIDFGENNPISEKKKETALYKLTAGTAYADMALSNSYVYNDVSKQASRNLREYNPIVFVGELAVYQHKSNGDYYCTQHRRGGAPEYGSGEVELQRFRKAFAWLWLVYMSDRLYFENYACEALLTEYFG